MNTAIALARLGQKVSFLGRLGGDLFADQLRVHIEDAGVGVELIVNSSLPTSLAVVTPRPDGLNDYAFHLKDTANFGWRYCEFPILEGSDWLHFGSLTPVIPPGSDAFLSWIRQVDSSMSVDLNIRPSIIEDRDKYWTLVEPILQTVGSRHGILKLSIEDLEWLLGDLSDDAEALQVATQWLFDYEFSLVVLTLGPQGAVAVKPDGRTIKADCYPVKVKDTIGAGDTFMAGFLSTWLDNPADLEAALRVGVAAAAIACTRVGANPPNKMELEEFFAKQTGPDEIAVTS